MKIKMKFVQLKAEGLPMYMIAKELGVHRTTLTMWNKQLAPYILVARQDFMDEILHGNNLSKLERVENISHHLSGLYDALNDPKIAEKNNFEYDYIVNAMLKFTKLLHLELGEKNTVKNLKSLNIPKPDGDITDEDEAPLWITDKESFDKFQPEGDRETDTSDAIITEDTEAEDVLIAEYLRDLSNEHPEIKPVFEKAIRRQPRKKARVEKAIKNQKKNKTNVPAEQIE
ncbi:MAG: hypothetical protein J0M18_02880 [Ignavibacteria bacterium]|nr:hypothetical protein [Ignavibacteria bacterium]